MALRNPRSPQVLTLLKTVIACLLSLAASSLSADNRQLEVIPLQHRPADLIVPTLQGVASQDTLVTATGNQLVIRATASEMAHLKALIQQLDQPLTQFRISVRQQGKNSQGSRGVDGNYTYHNSQSGIKVGRTTLDGRPLPADPDSGARITTHNNQHRSSVTIKQYSTRGNSNTTQQLRAVEGYPAYIETGQQVPFLSRYYDRHGSGVEQSYQPVVTGFYVTLTMTGSDRVTLDIATSKQSVEEQAENRSRNPTVNTAAYQSTISAPLGEWIDLGSSLEGGNSQTSGAMERRSVNARESLNLQLKVERSP